jgi:hypothetical protein
MLHLIEFCRNIFPDMDARQQKEGQNDETPQMGAIANKFQNLRVQRHRLQLQISNAHRTPWIAPLQMRHQGMGEGGEGFLRTRIATSVGNE